MSPAHAAAQPPTVLVLDLAGDAHQARIAVGIAGQELGRQELHLRLRRILWRTRERPREIRLAAAHGRTGWRTCALRCSSGFYESRRSPKSSVTSTARFDSSANVHVGLEQDATIEHAFAGVVASVAVPCAGHRAPPLVAILVIEVATGASSPMRSSYHANVELHMG